PMGSSHFARCGLSVLESEKSGLHAKRYDIVAYIQTPNIRMSVVSPLLMSLLAVTMETVWCQDHVFSREQLTQALSKLTERVTELEEKEKEAGELGKLVEQLGDKMTEGIGKLGDKMTEGIGDLGEQLKENLGKIN
ncbi:hypothetical protein BaRGS_00036919, partial [Batillaria attramentaria]